MDMENGSNIINDNNNNNNSSSNNNSSVLSSDNVNILNSQSHHLTKQGLNNLTYQVSSIDILYIAINTVSPNERIIILFVLFYFVYF